jgi:hypothetical protein
MAANTRAQLILSEAEFFTVCLVRVVLFVIDFLIFFGSLAGIKIPHHQFLLE